MSERLRYVYEYCCVCVCSSKGSTLSKRPSKKVESGEEGRGLDTQSPLDDLERNQKILQWMMEGEALRHKKNTHG